jgi:hypothetical protein
MRRVPTAFFIEIGGKSKAQSLQYLLNAPTYQRGIGLHVDDAQRLELLKDLAVLIARLHRHDVVVGDLSPKNVLFTLVGRPRCLLIDCDSMRYRGQSVVEQVDTTAWEVPDGEERATPLSDAMKFGRLAVRIFNGDQDSLDRDPLAVVSPALAELAEQSQRSDPGSRPALDAWVEPLEYALDRMLDKPPAPDPPTAPLPGLYATQSPPRPAFIPSPGFVPPPGTRPPGHPGAPGGRWGNPPYPPYPQPPRKSGRTKGVLSAGLALAALLLVGFGIAQADGDDPSQNTGLSSSQDTGLPTDQDTFPDPATDDSSGGYLDTPTDDSGAEESTAPDLPADQVEVDTTAVDADPAAVDVAGMFSRFYGAVNVQDYDTALSLYDPASTSVDVNDDASRSQWEHTMSTTQESDVVLIALADSGPYTMASVSFRSRQDAGFGPGGAQDETCTDWDVTYQLTMTDGQYRILKAPREGVSHTGC